MPSIRSLLLAVKGLPVASAGALQGRRCSAYLILLAGFVLFLGQPALGQSKVYWITDNNASIVEAELDGSNAATVFQGMPAPNGMDVDAAGGKMYWVDGILGKVFRANVDGSSQEELLTGLSGPSDVALDVSGGKMYWTDLNAGEIGRADLDGGNVETLLAGLSEPVAIAVDGSGGKFYWTDNTDGKVQRADLDGSNVEDLITGLTFGVSAIGLDLTNGKVYWIDAFGNVDRANLDGTASGNLLFDVGDFMAVDASGGKIYWTDQLGQKLRRANLDGTGDEDLITGLDAPTGIGLDLTNSKVYWTDPLSGDRVQRANLDGTTVEAVITPEVSSVGDLAVAGGKIYWTDNGIGKLRRANVDGTSPEDLVTGLAFPVGIRIDEAAGKMYWTDQGTAKVQRANLDGSSSEDLVTGLNAPRHLDLDVAGGKMYWTDAAGEIRGANLDGSSEAAVISGLVDPYGVAVGSLYWADNGKIQSANNDGTGQADVVTGLISPYGVALDASAGKLYYTDQVGQLRRVNTDGSSDELLASGLFGPSALALSIETVLSETTVAASLSGSSPAAANDEVQVFGIGITGDGSSSINSIDITLSDLTSATGLSAADISELRLYTSTDILLDGGDTQIGNETTISIGSATTITATTPDVPGNGTEVFYLISAVVAASPTGGHTFRVGFAANGVTTSGSPLGTAVTAADADNVTILHLTETTAAAGLSGASTASPSGEVQVYSIGITGDGVSGFFGVNLTLSDLTAATGLAAADITELRLYSSTDATLDGGDTQIGNETTINIGSATTIAATTPDVPGFGSEVFYLVSAAVAASPTNGHAFRLGFATGGVTTSLGILGTAVAAADADKVTISVPQLTETTAAAGLSGSSPAVAADEVQIFAVGITGDGSSSVNSIDITLSDLTSATGLAAADISELRLYSSTDVVLDGGDTQIGNETSINIGSVTMVAAGSPDVPGNGTEVFYLVSAVVASAPTGGHVFRVGFAANGVTTSGSALGTVVTAADADNVTILHLTETTAAAGLSGASTASPSGEVQIFSVGITGDGVSGLFGIDITLSDLTSATGLAASDVSELRLYSSTDATLDGGDTQIGNETTISIGSATTVAATSPDAPGSGTEVFYLVSAVIDASPTDGHVFRAGLAAGGVTTSLGTLGTAVTAADADRVTINASPAAQLVFTTQPGGSTHLGALSVVVEARDASNATDNSFVDPVTLTVSPSGTLTGGTVTAVNGVATFSGITISGAGNGLTLVASGGGLNGTSASFNVAKADAEVSLSGLGLTYNGDARSASVATIPGGLGVTVTYDGSANPPVGPGSYSVVAVIDDPNFEGTAAGSLVIGNPPAPVIDLRVSALAGLAPLQVTFTDSSTGFITQRVLEPADDEATVAIDPEGSVTVTYSQAGTHEAVLYIRALGGAAEHRVPITVYELPPVAGQTVDEGQILTVALVPSSAMEALQLTVAPQLPGARLENGEWHWIPDFEQSGTYTLTATATDALGTRQTQSFTLVVNESVPPVLTTDPVALDFGNVLAGRSVERSFDLNNPSDRPLVLSRFGLDDPAFVVLSPDLPVTIDPGNLETFQVRFDARHGAQPHVATLEASTNLGPILTPMAGRSLWAALAPDADTLNFGTVLRGKSAQLHLILDNTGTIPVRGAVAIDDPSFVVEPERFTVEPGLSQELAITFSPARAVNHVARLRFLDVEPFVGPALTIDSIPVLGFASPLVVADFNGDRVVDMDDFFAFAEVAFKELTPESAAFDLTRDGRIDFADLFRFSDLFGEVMPVILGRSTELDPVSQEYLSLYGRAIRALTADLANGIVRPGETVRDTRSGRATELVIDIELPDELETLHFENDEATLDGLSADLVITGSSQLPGGLTPLRNEPDTRLPDSPVTDVPVGFVTSDGEELAVHGNVVTLPRARARFDYGRLRSSDEPTMQEAIQEIRAFRPELTQETIDVHCNGGGYVSVDKVFSELYDSGLPGAPVEELYWVLATNNVTYDCETQKYAANFMLQYLRSVRSGNEPVVSEEFIVSESLQR